MKSIESRIKRIEDKLDLNKEQQVINIVFFGDGDLPPDRTEGNITVHYVRYDNGVIYER